MIRLKEKFRLNGLPYTLLKRNEVVALYGIGGTYSKEIRHWEVDVIYPRKDQYGEREHIAKNDNFGRDRSRCYKDKQKALAYFDKLTSELMNERKLSQGVLKVVSGVQENMEVILEPHFEEICEPCY
jgi:hypothetical protein